MIRQAKAVDVPVIAAMLREMYALSKYQGRVAISEKAMENMLLSAVAQQGQFGPQASYCVIAEVKGEPAGFMIGMLDRVYHIGDKLVANDVYLFVRPSAKAAHSLAMVRGYLDWARANRKVIEIKLSWTDALPGAAAVARLYRRLGGEKVGEIYELRTDGGKE